MTERKIALFVTCLVNAYRPSTAFSSIRVLESAGFSVTVPTGQTCCGQPNYNNGDKNSTITTAQLVIDSFLEYDYVVAPSSSCAGMIKNHYPKLFEASSESHRKACALSEKTFEITDFIYQHALSKLPVNKTFEGTFTHHDSCSSLREMAVQHQVREIARHCLPKASIKELQEPEACCGFGGTFCVKFNDISKQLGNNKLKDIELTGARICTSLDTGCSLHLDTLRKEPYRQQISHFISFLDNALTS